MYILLLSKDMSLMLFILVKLKIHCFGMGINKWGIHIGWIFLNIFFILYSYIYLYNLYIF